MKSFGRLSRVSELSQNCPTGNTCEYGQFLLKCSDFPFVICCCCLFVHIEEKRHVHVLCNYGSTALWPIRPCTSKDFKSTILSVAPFMVQISPKDFHSLKPQNHVTFNSSQIFEAHFSSLLKFLLAP